METQKSLFRRIVDITLLAGVVFALLWVLRIGLGSIPQETTQPASNLLYASPYPPPPTPTTTPPGYPAPPLGPLASVDYCANMGQWLTYTNQAAGFSIQYPSEAKIYDNQANIDLAQDFSELVIFYLYPHCYDPSMVCGGQNAISFRILQNPQQLQIDEFIEQKFQLFTTPPTENSLQNYQETGFYIYIANTKALRVEAGVSYEGTMPEIFIPHDNRVLHISTGTGGTMPPFSAPCEQTLQLMDQMLDTLVLFPAQQ